VGDKPYAQMSAAERWARKSKGWQRMRLAMMATQRTCWLCGRQITDPRDYTVDHVVPLAQGGTNAPSNLRPAHGRKNADCPGNYGRHAAPARVAATSREW